MLKFILLPLLFFATVNGLWSTIVKVETANSIKEILAEASKNDLVVFDVDQTLILPNDKLLRPCGDTYFQNYLFKIGSQLSEERIHYLGSIMLLQRSINLVDSELPKIIHELQQRPCKVIALTAMITGRLGLISSMEDWRLGELKSLDIDFSNTFPKYNHIAFGDIMKNGSLPIFKNGILCSAKHPKGEILEAFLNRVKWLPNKVYFIDDYLPFLESVQKHVNEMDIDFIGIHYRAIDTLDDVFDEKMADNQLKHLIEKEEWLSDDQYAETFIKFDANIY